MVYDEQLTLVKGVVVEDALVAWLASSVSTWCFYRAHDHTGMMINLNNEYFVAAYAKLWLLVGDDVVFVYDIVLVIVHISRVVHSQRGADTILAQHAN